MALSSVSGRRPSRPLFPGSFCNFPSCVSVSVIIAARQDRALPRTLAGASCGAQAGAAAGWVLLGGCGGCALSPAPRFAVGVRVGQGAGAGPGAGGAGGARRERILGEEVCGRVGQRAAVNAGTLGIDGALGQLALPLHPAPAGDERTVLVPNGVQLTPGSKCVW